MNAEHKIVSVGFHGGTLEAVKRDGTVWISVKRACEELGLNADGQRVKLREKPWARTEFISVPDSRGCNQSHFMIDLKSFPLWLAGIEASRVSEDVREMLIRYQLEAADVLYQHFFKQVTTPRNYIEALEAALELARTNEVLSEKNERLVGQAKKDEPFVNAGRAMLNTEVACQIGDFAKVVRIGDKILGPQKMFDYLREKEVLFKRKKRSSNLPYQNHIEAGRFIVRQGSHPNGDGGEDPHFTTYITPKGEGYVINMMINDPDFNDRAITVRGQDARSF